MQQLTTGDEIQRLIETQVGNLLIQVITQNEEIAKLRAEIVRLSTLAKQQEGKSE